MKVCESRIVTVTYCDICGIEIEGTHYSTSKKKHFCDRQCLEIYINGIKELYIKTLKAKYPRYDTKNQIETIVEEFIKLKKCLRADLKHSYSLTDFVQVLDRFEESLK